MEDLSQFADAEFDGIVALGIYQQAESEGRWTRVLLESARLLEARRVLSGRKLCAWNGIGCVSTPEAAGYEDSLPVSIRKRLPPRGR